MSKDRLDMTLEAMREDLVEYINDENLDILDEFPADVLANEVISIAQRLMVRDFCNGHLIKYGNGRRNIDYLYSIDNSLKGFVSLSDDCSTAVSRTEYKPFFHDDEDGYYTGLCSLVSMINEAWYHLTND